jgi:hypothetical protein
MATDKQNEANRQNAQKSTGPRSAEGKARSSMNHLTSGIYAASALIPGEDPAGRQALSERYFAQCQPMTEQERHQVDILVQCDWLARRYVRADAQMWNRSMEYSVRKNDPNPMADGYSLCPKNFGRLDCRIEKNERRYNRAQHELERLQSLRRAPEAADAAAEATEPAPAPEPPPPQPAETEDPPSKMGSNGQNASPCAPGSENRKPVASESPHDPVYTPKSA